MSSMEETELVAFSKAPAAAGRHAPSPRAWRPQLERCASVLTTSDTEISSELPPLERAVARPRPRQQLLQVRREVSVERWGGVTGVWGSELHDLDLRGTQSSHNVDATRWRAWAVNNGCSCVLCCTETSTKGTNPSRCTAQEVPRSSVKCHMSQGIETKTFFGHLLHDQHSSMERKQQDTRQSHCDACARHRLSQMCRK